MPRPSVSPTAEQCAQFARDPSKNPLTNRHIKDTSPIRHKLVVDCLKYAMEHDIVKHDSSAYEPYVPYEPLPASPAHQPTPPPSHPPRPVTPHSSPPTAPAPPTPPADERAFTRALERLPEIIRAYPDGASNEEVRTTQRKLRLRFGKDVSAARRAQLCRRAAAGVADDVRPTFDRICNSLTPRPFGTSTPTVQRPPHPQLYSPSHAKPSKSHAHCKDFRTSDKENEMARPSKSPARHRPETGTNLQRNNPHDRKLLNEVENEKERQKNWKPPQSSLPGWDFTKRQLKMCSAVHGAEMLRDLSYCGHSDRSYVIAFSMVQVVRGLLATATIPYATGLTLAQIWTQLSSQGLLIEAVYKFGERLQTLFQAATPTRQRLDDGGGKSYDQNGRPKMVEGQPAGRFGHRPSIFNFLQELFDNTLRDSQPDPKSNQKGPLHTSIVNIVHNAFMESVATLGTVYIAAQGAASSVGPAGLAGAWAGGGGVVTTGAIKAGMPSPLVAVAGLAMSSSLGRIALLFYTSLWLLQGGVELLARGISGTTRGSKMLYTANTLRAVFGSSRLTHQLAHILRKKSCSGYYPIQRMCHTNGAPTVVIRQNGWTRITGPESAIVDIEVEQMEPGEVRVPRIGSRYLQKRGPEKNSYQHGLQREPSHPDLYYRATVLKPTEEKDEEYAQSTSLATRESRALHLGIHPASGRGEMRVFKYETTRREPCELLREDAVTGADVMPKTVCHVYGTYLQPPHSRSM